MIKKIYTFGTSFTDGGGFEFKINNTIKYPYNGLGEEYTKQNFSYPGQLIKLLPNVEIINLAKSGYGNERIYRLASDIVFSDDFNSDESLFIIEFSHLGRKEYFSKELNDYFIVNYVPNNISNSRIAGLAREYNLSFEEYQADCDKLSYLKDTQHIDLEVRKKANRFFNKWFELTYDEKTWSQLVANNSSIFLSFLKNRNVNYLFTAPPYFINHKNYDNLLEPHLIKGLRINGNHCIHDYYPNATISNETNNFHEDGHYGLIKNKLIASHIYDELVNRNMISGNKLNKKWKDFNNIEQQIRKNTEYLQRNNEIT